MLQRLFAAFGATSLLAASGVAWYALSSPPVENLPLARELISIDSPEGQRLLASAASKTDYAQLEPHLVAQARRARPPPGRPKAGEPPRGQRAERAWGPTVAQRRARP